MHSIPLFPLKVKPQSARAAKLCPEVLQEIFQHLQGGDAYGRFPRADAALLSTPRVCRSWSYPATIALYQRVQLTNPRSIRLFFRTLQKTRLGAFVNVIHIAATFRPATPRVHVLTKWNWTGVEGILNTLMTQCPNLNDLSLDIEQGRDNVCPFESRALFTQLRSLRIPSTYGRLVAAISNGGVDLPNLEELTLSGWAIWSGSWPTLPRLRRLCLDRTNLSGPALTALINAVSSTLTHLTFVGFCAIATPHFDEICTLTGPTLESLTLVDNCFCVLSAIGAGGSLARLTKLSTLKVDCLSIGVAQDFFLKLPPNLRVFYLISSLGYGRCMNIQAPLSLLMCNPAKRYPQLKSLHVIGDSNALKTLHPFLQARCEAHGLSLTLDCVESPPSAIETTKTRNRLSTVAFSAARGALDLVDRIRFSR